MVDVPDKPGKPAEKDRVSTETISIEASRSCMKQAENLLQGLGQSFQPLDQRQVRGGRRSHGGDSSFWGEKEERGKEEEAGGSSE